MKSNHYTSTAVVDDCFALETTAAKEIYKIIIKDQGNLCMNNLHIYSGEWGADGVIRKIQHSCRSYLWLKPKFF